MAWKGRAWVGNRYSDKEKFCNDLNGPKTPKMSERPLKTPTRFPDFQAAVGRCQCAHYVLDKTAIRRTGSHHFQSDPWRTQSPLSESRFSVHTPVCRAWFQDRGPTRYRVSKCRFRFFRSFLRGRPAFGAEGMLACNDSWTICAKWLR